MADQKILRLKDVASRVAGHIELDDGRQLPVLRITGVRYHDLLSTEDLAERGLLSIDVARECVPDLASDDFARLTIEEVHAITAIASSGIEAVEQLFPNAVRPATASTSPASGPTTASASSS